VLATGTGLVRYTYERYEQFIWDGQNGKFIPLIHVRVTSWSQLIAFPSAELARRIGKEMRGLRVRRARLPGVEIVAVCDPNRCTVA